MTYVMSRRMYNRMITDPLKMTDEEILIYLNQAFGIRGTITSFKVEGHSHV